MGYFTELTAQVSADRRYGDDDDSRDEGSEQDIFDRCGAGVILGEPKNKMFHEFGSGNVETETNSKPKRS
jgi:hypothetical protein